MANRIEGNIIIVDSGMGNFPIVGGTTSNYKEFSIIGIGFFSTTTSAACSLSQADTSSHFIKFDFQIQNSGSAGTLNVIPRLQTVSFAAPLRVNDLKCPVLTAGTAWIYLS